MRKIINSTYVTLDGVIQNPQNWPSLESTDDTGDQVQHDLLSACDALLLGRHTYEAFAPVWSARAGDPYSDRINSMAKHVVSTTLTEPAWTNTRVIAGDVVDEIGRLKDQPGQDIVQYGFGRLSYTLLEHGLLDELRLWVHPFFVGTGGPHDLLYQDTPPARFRLEDVKTLSSGIAILYYRTA